MRFRDAQEEAREQPTRQQLGSRGRLFKSCVTLPNSNFCWPCRPRAAGAHVHVPWDKRLVFKQQ